MIRRLWEFTARWRTWLFNVVAIIVIALPDVLAQLLAAPELAQVVPAPWKPWLGLATLLINIWMRPRRAVLATDFEASVSRSREAFSRRPPG